MLQVASTVVLLVFGVVSISCGVFYLSVEIFDIMVLRTLARHDQQKPVEDAR